MQIAPRIIHAQSLAQRIEAVALAWIAIARHLQRIQHAAAVGNATQTLLQRGEFGVEKAHVEASVVDDQLGAIDKRQKLLDHVGEQRLVEQKLILDTGDLPRAFVHRPTGVEVGLVVASG